MWLKEVWGTFVLEYDLRTSFSKAFGSNEYFKRFGVDNLFGKCPMNVDTTDVISIYSDATNFVNGYDVPDVNGDNITDVSDLIITLNNSNNFVSVRRPS